MKIDQVHEFLDVCEDLSIKTWFVGGWGIDALLERQTRDHNDLDIVVQQIDVQRLDTALRELGFEDHFTDDHSRWNYVLAHPDGRKIDFHVVVFDDDGRGIYGPIENGYSWDASAFEWSGTIGDRIVLCTSPESQMESHTGYDHDEDDIHDVRLLAHKFGIPIPDQYA